MRTMAKQPILVIPLLAILLIGVACTPKTMPEKSSVPSRQPVSPMEPMSDETSASMPDMDVEEAEEISPDELDNVTADLDGLDW